MKKYIWILFFVGGSFFFTSAQGCLCSEAKSPVSPEAAYSRSGRLYFYWRNYSSPSLEIPYRVTNLKGEEVLGSTDRPFYASYGEPVQSLDLTGVCERGGAYVLELKEWNGLYRRVYFVHGEGGSSIDVSAKKSKGSCNGKAGLTVTFTPELEGEGLWDLEWYVSASPFEGIPTGPPEQSESKVEVGQSYVLSEAGGLYVLLVARDACGLELTHEEYVDCSQPSARLKVFFEGALGTKKGKGGDR